MSHINVTRLIEKSKPPLFGGFAFLRCVTVLLQHRRLKHMRKLLIAAATALAISTTAYAAKRDYISIVGSSTVYPFSTVVAETFGKTTKYKTPKIESTGTGGGFKLFCAGVGVEHPDVSNASRAIKKSEVKKCAANGITPIEVKVGYDGIVVANAINATAMELTRRDLYLALAKQVPNPNGSKTFVDNPYTTWNDVNSDLPDTKIEVLGPPPTSGTRDAFVELAMEGGAKTFDWLSALRKEDKKKFKGYAHTLREDGAYIEAGENDNLIVQKLNANKNAFGIFGFSFLDQNGDKVKGASVDGVVPTFDSIADQSYPVSRPLFFYVKKEHIGTIPGLKAFVATYTNKNAMGEDGYLSDRGLIPLPEDEYLELRRVVGDL